MQSQLVQNSTLKSGSGNRGKEEIKEWLSATLADTLKIERSEISATVSFTHYGLDSLTAIGLSETLGNWLGRDLEASLLYEYPTIEALASYLTEETR